MDEYFADKLTEIQDTEDTAYLLENNEIFYDVGYKVMQNQENANLLRCHKTNLFHKRIYITGGLHCIFGYGYDLKCDSQFARSFNSD